MVTAVVVITGVGVASQEEPEPILRPVLEQWHEATDLCAETWGWFPDKVRIIREVLGLHSRFDDGSWYTL